MAFDKITRPNSGSGTVKIIDGIEFQGLSSAGFGENDFLFIGTDGDDFDLIGGSGNDEIEGEGGNDLIAGGEGNDTLEGGSGDDDIDGQEGTDILDGGAGNDILRGGYGHDQMYGGSGNDTFGFYALGFFRVHDFTVGEDRLFFDADKTGINSIEELKGLISGVDDRGNDGFTVNFGDPSNPAASIDIVGVNINEITADMIVFHL